MNEHIKWKTIEGRVCPVLIISQDLYENILCEGQRNFTIPYEFNDYFRQPQSHTLRPDFPPYIVLKYDFKSNEEITARHKHTTYTYHPTQPYNCLLDIHLNHVLKSAT